MFSLWKMTNGIYMRSFFYETTVVILDTLILKSSRAKHLLVFYACFLFFQEDKGGVAEKNHDCDEIQVVQQFVFSPLKRTIYKKGIFNMPE